MILCYNIWDKQSILYITCVFGMPPPMRGRAPTYWPLEQEYLHKFYKKIIMPDKDKTFQCVKVHILPNGSARLRMQQIDNLSNIETLSIGRFDDVFELSSIATDNAYCVFISK